jgi:hypothetical protein
MVTARNHGRPFLQDSFILYNSHQSIYLNTTIPLPLILSPQSGGPVGVAPGRVAGEHGADVGLPAALHHKGHTRQHDARGDACGV